MQTDTRMAAADGRTDRVVSVLFTVAGASFVGLYLWVVAHRLFYPYELQWMEGGSVELVSRLLHGRPLYVSPTLRFTPWPYPPLYHALSAVVAWFTGVGFLPLRLVSVVASLGVLVAIFVLVRAETGDRAVAVLAAGAYAATFHLAGAWADIGRVDSLWLLLCLIAIVVARRASTGRDGIVAGVTLFLAAFTKQDGLIVAVPLAAALLATRRRAGEAALGSLAFLLVASTWAMNVVTHGWYGFFVGRELVAQPFLGRQLTGFWIHDILGPLPVLVALTILGCTVLVRSARGECATQRIVVAAGLAGLVAAGWVGRLHSGGFANVLMPAYAGVVVLAGIGLSCARRRAVRAKHAVARHAATACLVVALAWQFAHAAYPVAAQIPTASDARAGDRFVELVRRLPGHVVVLIHPWYATVAHKGDFAAGAAVQDLLRSRPSLARRALVRDERTALLAPDIGAVILDQAPDPVLARQLAVAYRALPQEVIAGRAFFPVTDLRLRPSFIYVRLPPYDPPLRPPLRSTGR